MDAVIRRAETSDVDQLVDLMDEFYAESGFAHDRSRARRSFADLLADPSLGQVWLIKSGGKTAGYMVLTLGYSMEYGGRDAFVDDLYLRAAHRGVGLGTAALEVLLSECRRRGVRAVHLEVGRANAAARVLYARAGFSGHDDRQLLTRRLVQGGSEG